MDTVFATEHTSTETANIIKFWNGSKNLTNEEVAELLTNNRRFRAFVINEFIPCPGTLLSIPTLEGSDINSGEFEMHLSLRSVTNYQLPRPSTWGVIHKSFSEKWTSLCHHPVDTSWLLVPCPVDIKTEYNELSSFMRTGGKQRHEFLKELGHMISASFREHRCITITTDEESPWFALKISYDKKM